MAILTPQQRQAELQRKASLGIKPTDAKNTAQYNAIVAKTNTPKTTPVQSPVTPTSTSPQVTKPASPLLGSIGAKTGVAPVTQTTPKPTSAYDWGKLTNGSYESVAEFNKLKDSMVGQDRNQYANDQQALTLYDYANGQKNFGNGVNQYAKLGYADGDKRYDNDISRADQTVMLLHSQLGEQGFKDFAKGLDGKNGLEISQMLNGMGMNGVNVDVLQKRVNEAMGIGGVTTTPQDKAKYNDWASSVNINGQNVLQNGLQNNYSVKADNSIGLNDMITNVNGQPMHIYNALKYGTGADANKDLYSNMLNNEKAGAGTQAVPLKARAELAPDTMTPEMKIDYDEQIQIEDMLSKQMFVLNQIQQMTGGTPVTQPISSDTAGTNTGADVATGDTNSTPGGVASGGLAQGIASASGANAGQGDMSILDFITSQGKNSQRNILDGLTPEQINQMSAILQKMNGLNK